MMHSGSQSSWHPRQSSHALHPQTTPSPSSPPIISPTSGTVARRFKSILLTTPVASHQSRLTSFFNLHPPADPPITPAETSDRPVKRMRWPYSPRPYVSAMGSERSRAVEMGAARTLPSPRPNEKMPYKVLGGVDRSEDGARGLLVSGWRKGMGWAFRNLRRLSWTLDPNLPNHAGPQARKPPTHHPKRSREPHQSRLCPACDPPDQQDRQA